MKGQHLLVRFAVPADLEELQSFYRNEHPEHDSNRADGGLETPEVVTESVIGKLVGDVVAHVRFTRSADTLLLRSIYVARLLRRKRIGRFMITELARLAGREGAARIVAPAGCDADSFLRACGFQPSDDEESLTMKINLEEDL